MNIKIDLFGSVDLQTKQDVCFSIKDNANGYVIETFRLFTDNDWNILPNQNHITTEGQAMAQQCLDTYKK